MRIKVLGVRIVSVIVLIVSLFSCVSKEVGIKKRSDVKINSNWFYLENNAKTMNEILNEEDWKQIDLPHTWNALDATDITPGYRRSASWYKKDLEISNLAEDQKYLLYFEGVNIESDVYVNGKRLGGHVGGYIGFSVDFTSVVKKGINEVWVRVDNSFNPEVIPSQKSDFFIFGGITRDVWFKILPKQHLASLKISTPNISNESSDLIASFEIENFNENKKVKATLFDDKGKEVVSKTIDASQSKMKVAFRKIEDLKLWHTERPNLYSLKLELLENNKVLDEVSETIGFRWFEFKDHGAFYLNGERLLLRGTHRHEEHAGVGAAMTNKQHRADMELIKEMGANFVRLAHYPQDPEVYNACNELGLLVWDELPWCRGGLGNDVWKANSKRMLKEIIAQNFNHPSIILWSLGNEIYWLPDFEDGDNKEKINDFLQELNDTANELDPSRKTAIRKYYEGSDIVDVFSPSIWSGWYSGNYKNYQKAIDKYKKKYSHFLHAEYGGSSHVGRHTENPITGEGKIESDGWEEAIVQTNVANIAQIGDWSENYIVDLFDWHLRVSESDSTFVGNIQWAFKDFGTPLRPENAIPYMNQKGVVDRAGKPKDAFYVFKSYWSNDPFTYIESHTWTDRQGPKGKSRDISVYSNCLKVELFLNGKSLGIKERNSKSFPAAGLNWSVNFTKGENKLKSVGVSNDGKTVEDELIINYRYVKNKSAKSLKLTSHLLNNGNYLVTATALDKNGLRCLDYEKKVYFQCLNGGRTIVSQGTPTGSEIIEMSNGQASIEVERFSKEKELEVMVLNQSFKGTYLIIK